MEIEITEEKSQQLAIFIRQIAFNIRCIDLPYLEACAKDMREQANRQESMAVLNPRHPQEANDLLRTQAKALQTLADYIHCLKEVDKQKATLANVKKAHSEIDKLFM